MVIKLYISGISGNKEVKKKQQRVQMILDSKQITYEAIDITEPGKEKDKEFMQQNGKVRESLGKYPLPPQIFNDDDFCGDYEDFDMANEVDELEKFLHIATESKGADNNSKGSKVLNVNTVSFEKPSKMPSYDPYQYHTYKVKWDNVNGLQEEIISNSNPSEETEKVIEQLKSEMNGESDNAPASELLETVENKPVVETEEVSVPVKEDEEKEVEEKKEIENTKEELEAETEKDENSPRGEVLNEPYVEDNDDIENKESEAKEERQDNENEGGTSQSENSEED